MRTDLSHEISRSCNYFDNNVMSVDLKIVICYCTKLLFGGQQYETFGNAWYFRCWPAQIKNCPVRWNLIMELTFYCAAQVCKCNCCWENWGFLQENPKFDGSILISMFIKKQFICFQVFCLHNVCVEMLGNAIWWQRQGDNSICLFWLGKCNFHLRMLLFAYT